MEPFPTQARVRLPRKVVWILVYKNCVNCARATQAYDGNQPRACDQTCLSLVLPFDSSTGIPWNQSATRTTSCYRGLPHISAWVLMLKRGDGGLA